MNRLLACSVCVFVCLSASMVWAQTPPAAQKQLPLEYFTKHAEFSKVRISPDGETIAVSIAKKGKASLSFIALKDAKVYGSLGNDKHEFLEYEWVSNTRVVYTLGEYFGDLSAPKFTGEIFAVDRDMKNGKMIYGYRAGNRDMSTGHVIKVQQSSYAMPEIVSTLRGDDKKILITEQRWRENAGSYIYDPDIKPTLTLLDVWTGEKVPAGGIPISVKRIILDHEDRPRVATGSDEKLRPVTAWKVTPADQWKIFALPGFRDDSVKFLSFTDDNESILLLGARENDSHIGFYKVNLKTLAAEKVFAFPDANVRGAERDFTGRKIVGLVSDGDRSTTHWFDEGDATAKMKTGIERAFPKHDVVFESASADGKKVVVRVASDTNPGDYYLFDASTMKVSPLSASRPWIDPKLMRPKEPFTIKARDGLELHGYVTRPTGAGPFPLVVLPHGGPRLRDTMEYDSEVQLLANRGYAVMQVNFRGSEGYGREFVHAGDREWGRKMQDDITDATRWALEQKISTPDRVCIYGASYGGYAALMGVIREPKLYKCAIGYVGVYDLELMYSKGDIQTNASGTGYLEEVLGRDREDLHARSPVYNADKIEVPVMLIHGKEDWRVDFEHAKRMRAALDKNKKQYEWLPLNREGHGAYDEDTRLLVYERILAFLDKNLMSGSK